jgi:hypothetical protein
MSRIRNDEQRQCSDYKSMNTGHSPAITHRYPLYLEPFHLRTLETIFAMTSKAYPQQYQQQLAGYEMGDRPAQMADRSQAYYPQSTVGSTPEHQQAYSNPYATPAQRPAPPVPQMERMEVQSPQQSMSSTVYDDELTEEERIEYEKGVLTWSKCKNWRFWIRKEWKWYYLIFLVIVVLVALMAFFHRSVGRHTHPHSVLTIDHRLADTGHDSFKRSPPGMADSCCCYICVVVSSAVR